MFVASNAKFYLLLIKRVVVLRIWLMVILQWVIWFAEWIIWVFWLAIFHQGFNFTTLIYFLSLLIWFIYLWIHVLNWDRQMFFIWVRNGVHLFKIVHWWWFWSEVLLLNKLSRINHLFLPAFGFKSFTYRLYIHHLVAHLIISSNLRSWLICISHDCWWIPNIWLNLVLRVIS